jgi:hypothetical protein
LVFLGCNSSTGQPASEQTTSANTVLFDPSASIIPLPNILATATAKDPFMNYSGNYGPRPANKPLTPPEALAYVNKYEMGETNAVAGLNAPIYIRVASPVIAATVSAATIKVFQLSIDSNGMTENNPLAFTDVSAMFTYQYKEGSTDIFAFPNFPLIPGTRYLYVVTNRVKDAATGGSVSGSFYFEALKSTTPLLGSFAALEAIRANKMSDTNILLSGYAKVMDDLIAASATTTIASRSEITLLGRFITTGAGFVQTDSNNVNTRIPVESALRAFAAGGLPGGLPGKSWDNTVATPMTIPAAAYWSGAGLPGAPPASLDKVITGTINSAELSLDPVVILNNSATGIDQSSSAGAYNPAAGIVKPFRTGTTLTGYYHVPRSVPFVYLAPTAPNGELIIFQHGITGQKEQVLALAQSLTGTGYAVIAIDLPLHGALAVPTHSTGSVWGQDFMAVGAPLATRSNIQQAAFNLNRLELTLKYGNLAAAGIPTPTKVRFVGMSLGSIVGSYYLAGNTTLSTTSIPPYSQTTLNSDMKGFLSVPGGRLAYLMKDSPAFSTSINAGLAAKGIVVNSPTYNQFFQVTQTVIDPVDPASVTTPLVSGLPSRLSGRIVIQEAVNDLVIPNSSTRYFGNSLGGREVLGSVGATVAPGFSQLGYLGGTSPSIPTQFMYTLSGSTPAPKAAFARAIEVAGTTPAEGYFQFNQTGIGHGFLIDNSTPANTALGQTQLVAYLLKGVVVDPTSSGSLLTLAKPLPFIPLAAGEIRLPPVLKIFGY